MSISSNSRLYPSKDPYIGSYIFKLAHGQKNIYYYHDTNEVKFKLKIISILLQ